MTFESSKVIFVYMTKETETFTDLNLHYLTHHTVTVRISLEENQNKY